jgi:hypothetical protein
MPLLDRDDSLLVVIDLQPRFWGDSLDAEDRRCAAEAAARAAWLAAAATAWGIPAVVTEEAPDRKGPTDEAVLHGLPPGTPVLTKPVLGQPFRRASSIAPGHQGLAEGTAAVVLADPDGLDLCPERTGTHVITCATAPAGRLLPGGRCTAASRRRLPLVRSYI